jgi:crotonobetainyl-CoA:carnitine CoA-transferase CaiB-like acyl-CoA transferase
MGTPLEGIRVLDLTVWLQGPYSTAMLADMGAEVIKVEDVPQGDPARGINLSSATGIFPPSPINYLIELQSRGKKSVAINLRQEGAREAMHRLAAKSDVFVSNLRKAALEKYGLDYTTLSGINPGIIYATASGYGPKGPDAGLPAMDFAAQARGGMLSIIGEPDSPPPPTGVAGFADTVGAMQLALGITTALLTRERTGIGQEVHTSLLGGQLAVGALELHGYLFTGQNPSRVSRRQASNPLRINYEASDGRWLCFNLSQSDRYWEGFCRVLGIEKIVHDPRFSTAERRQENCTALVSLLDDVFATRPAKEWLQQFNEAQIICGLLSTYAEVAEDPQVVENGYVITVDHPVYGPLKELGIPIQLSKTPGKVRSAAPEFGQHTEEVLLEVAGYTWEEISLLKEQGAIL